MLGSRSEFIKIQFLHLSAAVSEKKARNHRGVFDDPRSTIAIAMTSILNSHRIDLLSFFGTLRPETGFCPPDLDYLFVLFTNRCGSNYLSQALASTGCFNEAGEVFNATTVLDHLHTQHLESFQDYFCHVSRMQSVDGRMTAKLNIEQIAILHDAGILGAILGRSRFILLERQDRLAQAISRTIAWQNHSWTSEQPRKLPDEGLVYSRERIEEELTVIAIENAGFYKFLASIHAAPLHFSYERLVANPQMHIEEVGSWLNLPPLELHADRIRIVRQASRVNDLWRERFLHEARGSARRASQDWQAGAASPSYAAMHNPGR